MGQLAVCDPQVSQKFENGLFPFFSIPFEQNSASIRKKAFQTVFLDTLKIK